MKTKRKKKVFNDRIITRAIDCGTHIAETGDTIRATADIIGCSKSTVHKDINERLIYVNKRLYNKARKKIAKNLQERHIRGGLATKHKHEEEKQETK